MNFFLPRRALRIVPFIPLLVFFGLSAYAAPPAAISVSISASNSGKLTCSNKAVTLTARATGSGVTIYRWTGPNSYIGAGAIVTVATAGIYKVTANNLTGQGTASVTVETDTTAPADVTATSSGPVTCANPSVTITANSTSSGVSYIWTGANGFTASSASAQASVPGGYLLTAIDSATGCKSRAFTSVFIDTAAPAGVAASSAPANAVMTCGSPNVVLTGSSGTAGVTYNWTGPYSFATTGAAATAANAGSYVLTATNPGNGCSSSATVSVTQNFVQPAGVTAINTSPLTCAVTTSTLIGNSTTPGVSYNWTGPNGFASSSTSVGTSTPGQYMLTVTGTNGCTYVTYTIVSIDTAAPTATINSVPANDTITCINAQVVLTGSSGTPGLVYNWTGTNNFTATGAAVTVTEPGTYLLYVTNPLNGCLSYLPFIYVAKNVEFPGGAIGLITSNKLSCFTTSVTVSAVGPTSGVIYTWTGPDGFSINNRVFNTSAGGRYTVTAVSSANGCLFRGALTVAADTAIPAGVTATNSGELTCDVTTVTLTGNSTTPGVTYLWTGPNGFADVEQISNMATDSGAYLLTVTNPNNGCIALDSTYVAADFTACSMVVRKVTSGTAATFNDSAATRGFSFKVYPNPVSTVAYVEFQSPTASQASVGIYNNLGVLERELFSNAVGANQSYRLMLDPGGLTAGIHYCVMRIDNKVYTQKLLLFPNNP